MPATVAPAVAQPGDLIALVCTDTFAGTYELAPEPAADTTGADVIVARVYRRVTIAATGAELVEVDWMRHEAAGRIGRTVRTFRLPDAPVHAPAAGSATDCTCGRTFGSTMGRRNHLTAAAKRAASEARAALVVADPHTDAECPSPACTDRHVESELCEHGRAMDAPCRPCAIAGHEPVDLPDDETDAEPAADLTDRERHLADCRPCTLMQPDGHEYVSLIDVRITADELADLAVRPDVDVVHREGARDALMYEVTEAAGRPEPVAADYAEAARLMVAAESRRSPAAWTMRGPRARAAAWRIRVAGTAARLAERPRA